MLPPKPRPLSRDSLTQQGELGLPAALFSPGAGGKSGEGVSVLPRQLDPL